MVIAMTSALLCLSATIYHEARGEPIAGKEAVAHVVLNRAEERDMNVCSVVLEKNQFSFVVNRKVPPVKEKEAFAESVNIAADILRGKKKDPTRGSTYFWSAHISKPSWSKKCLNTKRIGNHYFCSF